MTSATEKQCEYCDGSKKPIATEVDGEAHITLTPDDYEYPEGFQLDVYGRLENREQGDLVYSFIVPCCPMCGRRLKSGDNR